MLLTRRSPLIFVPRFRPHAPARARIIGPSAARRTVLWEPPGAGFGRVFRGRSASAGGPGETDTSWANLRNVTFGSYADTAALMADSTNFDLGEDKVLNGGGAGAAAAIVLASSSDFAAYGYTKSMEYQYTHGGTGLTSPEIRRTFTLASTVQELWCEFLLLWSSNFTTDNSLGYPNDHKLVFLDNNSDSFRWGFHVGMDGDVTTGANHGIGWDWPLGSGFPPDSNRAGLLANALWDGLPHVIRIYGKHSTTTSSADGAYKCWIDGVRYMQVASLNTQNATGGAERFKRVSFAHNKDDGPAATPMYIRWARCSVGTIDPGWT